MERNIRLICQNPECGSEFYVDRNHKHSKFCCRKCADKVHNKNRDIRQKSLSRIENANTVCENCGKKHDHLYGTGRFCSRKCQYEWIGRSSALKTGHVRSAKNNWVCLECGLVFRTRREKQVHNKIMHGKGRDVRCWNKGLTKENSDTIKKNAESVSNTLKQRYKNGYDNPNSPFCKSYWTEERRRIRSEQKKLLYKEHPEKHPNRRIASNRNQMTYPEKVAYDWLIEHNIVFESQFNFVTEKFNRYVDFYCQQYNIFIEIDGEYWHKDKEKDFLKDEDALNHGIKTFRIRSKEQIRNRLKCIFNNLDEESSDSS